MPLGNNNPTLSAKLHRAANNLTHWNFYRLHLLYFILTILLTSVIIYSTSSSDGPSFHLSYIDALFLCTSAMCNVGLTTANLGSLTGFQQSVIFALMPLGDITLVTISVVVVRKWFFQEKMVEFVGHSAAGKRVAKDIEREGEGDGGARRSGKAKGNGASSAVENGTGTANAKQRRRRQDQDRSGADSKLSHQSGYGGFPWPWEGVKASHFASFTDRFRKSRTQEDDTSSQDQHHYLSWHPELDHKGRFTSLTDAQRNELGGVEYRALKVLTWLLPAYALAWFSILLVVLTPWAMYSGAADVIRNAQPGRLHPAWWAVFATFSSYSNTGMNLLNSNMIPLRRDYLILIFTGAAILGGNTFYPVFLRLVIWLLSKAVRTHSELHHSLSFLLHHPRRCYLLLFPQKNTWILFAVQTSICLAAWIFWFLLNIDQPAIDPGFPGGQRAMDGLYQSVAIRSAGFYIIEMSSIAPALKFLYMIIMYISAYPFIMSLRQSNVYEERSLGQQDAGKYGKEGKGGAQNKGQSQLKVHIQNQLAYDIWWLLIAIFLICIIEHQPLRTASPGFTIFSVIFEVVSAYGNIGLSLGVPYNDYSLCGAWHILSKLILLPVMLRGRHRILPMAVDRAVLLPGQELMEKLDKEHSSSSDERFEEVEERVRDDERGSQAEGPKGGGEQDPEQDSADAEGQSSR